MFGCIAYAHVPESERRKFNKKSLKLRFIGYSQTQKGYRLLDMEKQKIVVRRDVIFSESDFGHRKAIMEFEEAEEIVEEEVEDALDDPEEIRKSQRVKKGQPPARYGFDEYAECANFSESTHIALRVSIDEPDTLKKALECLNAKEWQEATNSEYESLMQNKTWELTQKPNGRKTVCSKWIFKVKVGENGVERFKSRLVAKGYSQKYGIDYCETFSPVVRLTSLRTMLAYAVKNDMFIHQMDVETAFLNGDLEEEIYMEQPEGYVKPGNEHLVCKLKKSLYGLKQSPRKTAKRVMRYLKGTINLTLQYKKSGDSAIIGYSDADFAQDTDTRRSTTGNLFTLSGGAIAWISKKQPIVSLSTAEAEYIALSAAVLEAV